MGLRLIFFGTPPFAAKILNALLENGYQVLAIVTRPDKPKGRSGKPLPSAVKEFHHKKWAHLPLFQPPKASNQEFCSLLKAFNPDLFVVVAYGEIIKTNLLSVPKKMCINVHASLLPKYRGAAPMQRAIMEGEVETGVTIMEMVLEMDAGDKLEAVKVPISEEMTCGELEEKLCQVGIDALFTVLEKIEKGGVTKTPQNEEEVSFAPKITIKDREIHWDKTAEEIHNQVRALSPRPGAYSFIEIGGETKRLVIRKTRKVFNLKGPPGKTLLQEKNQWVIACKEGALALLEVQLEGKNPMPIGPFLRGISHPLELKIK